MKLAPIVLFVYNRLNHTQKTLEALKENALASESDLYIFSDGPKEAASSITVEAVRSYVKSVSGFKRVTIFYREANFGLAENIIQGVTQIINEYGKVIVLEDDIVTSPHFLRFMNDALSKYELEPKVWHVSGYTQPIESAALKTHFFIKPTSCWGWGTWKDRWGFFKKDPEFFISKFNDAIIRDFNLQNSYNYYSHIVKNFEREINTWAIFWYATVFFNHGLSLHPKKSFVMNVGHDESGVHCGISNKYDVPLVDSYEDCFPSELIINKSAEHAWIKYNKSFKESFFKRLMMFIKKRVNYELPSLQRK